MHSALSLLSLSLSPPPPSPTQPQECPVPLRAGLARLPPPVFPSPPAVSNPPPPPGVPRETAGKSWRPAKSSSYTLSLERFFLATAKALAWKRQPSFHRSPSSPPPPRQKNQTSYLCFTFLKTCTDPVGGGEEKRNNERRSYFLPWSETEKDALKALEKISVGAASQKKQQAPRERQPPLQSASPCTQYGVRSARAYRKSKPGHRSHCKLGGRTYFPPSSFLQIKALKKKSHREVNLNAGNLKSVDLLLLCAIRRIAILFISTTQKDCKASSVEKGNDSILDLLFPVLL